MKVRIKENSGVARIAARWLKASKVAIVFGRTIHLHNTTREEFLSDPHWVCHELCHVQQYKKFGFIGFLARYLAESVRHGYHKNKFEIEARASERVESLREGVTFY